MWTQFVGKVDLMWACVCCQHGVSLKEACSRLKLSIAKARLALLLLQPLSPQGLWQGILPAQPCSGPWANYYLEWGRDLAPLAMGIGPSWLVRERPCHVQVQTGGQSLCAAWDLIPRMHPAKCLLLRGLLVQEKDLFILAHGKSLWNRWAREDNYLPKLFSGSAPYLEKILVCIRRTVTELLPVLQTPLHKLSTLRSLPSSSVIWDAPTAICMNSAVPQECLPWASWIASPLIPFRV